MFVHTYGGNNGTIIFVKTPQYIIEFLLHPIRTKYLLLKVTSSPAGHFFSLIGKYEKLLIVRTGYASRPKQLVWQSVS